MYNNAEKDEYNSSSSQGSMQELVSQIFTYQDARYDHCHKGISSGMTIFHVEREWVKLSGQ